MASCDEIKLIKPRLLPGFNTPFGSIAALPPLDLVSEPDPLKIEEDLVNWAG